ncbi:hypothetical protein Q4489_06495 [Thalassotalea sp. 1_MG-2023]|uniref:hypothetical protein n=1 Tax=Thalassotalea sp. 1_MG-2023 TaxID=3062680 RepID=UPI0026E3953B|nr:hypothetical protein [Thalassotalea sp. 1_MG-2023]MDO6426655.1 hypothetical protein [Thalassotalea sp. 1_MG-2023]
MHFLLFLGLFFFFTTVSGEEFIGQWYVDNQHSQITAHTRDGDSQLHLDVHEGKVTAVRLYLPNFAHFGEVNAAFQYSSPKYGLIRTTTYHVDGEQVMLTDPFEIHSFVENLKDIATHLMFREHNLGNSFKDRKLTISYMDSSKKPKWRNAKFSTIEIDEVLQKLGVMA